MAGEAIVAAARYKKAAACLAAGCRRQIEQEYMPVVKEENPVKEKNPAKEENPVKPEDVSAHQKKVSMNQKPNPSQNVVWHTFWLKVRELNMREWGPPMPEAGEGDSTAAHDAIDSEDVPTLPNQIPALRA